MKNIENIVALVHKQKVLDDAILKEFGTEIDGELITKQTLALLVEIGEFANETRCFKHWSKKEPSPKDVQLEEYVDALHFLLSITHMSATHESGWEKYLVRFLDSVFADTDDVKELVDNKSLSELIVMVYQSVLDGYINELWGLFLVVGYKAGFTSEEIVEAYNAKNKINFQRLEEGY